MMPPRITPPIYIISQTPITTIQMGGVSSTLTNQTVYVADTTLQDRKEAAPRDIFTQEPHPSLIDIAQLGRNKRSTGLHPTTFTYVFPDGTVVSQGNRKRGAKKISLSSDGDNKSRARDVSQATSDAADAVRNRLVHALFRKLKEYRMTRDPEYGIGFTIDNGALMAFFTENELEMLAKTEGDEEFLQNIMKIAAPSTHEGELTAPIITKYLKKINAVGRFIFELKSHGGGRFAPDQAQLEGLRRTLMELEDEKIRELTSSAWSRKRHAFLSMLALLHRLVPIIQTPPVIPLSEEEVTYLCNITNEYLKAHNLEGVEPKTFKYMLMGLSSEEILGIASMPSQDAAAKIVEMLSLRDPNTPHLPRGQQMKRYEFMQIIGATIARILQGLEEVIPYIDAATITHLREVFSKYPPEVTRATNELLDLLEGQPKDTFQIFLETFLWSLTRKALYITPSKIGEIEALLHSFEVGIGLEKEEIGKLRDRLMDLPSQFISQMREFSRKYGPDRFSVFISRLLDPNALSEQHLPPLGVFANNYRWNLADRIAISASSVIDLFYRTDVKRDLILLSSTLYELPVPILEFMESLGNNISLIPLLVLFKVISPALLIFRGKGIVDDKISGIGPFGLSSSKTSRYDIN